MKQANSTADIDDAARGLKPPDPLSSWVMRHTVTVSMSYVMYIAVYPAHFNLRKSGIVLSSSIADT